MMEEKCINLNIHIDISPEIWEKIPKIYEQMPGWLGFGKGGKYGEVGIPYWYGYDNDPETINASVEPSGLLICAKMEVQKWEKWKNQFKNIATQVLGFKVDEVELGKT